MKANLLQLALDPATIIDILAALSTLIVLNVGIDAAVRCINSSCCRVWLSFFCPSYSCFQLAYALTPTATVPTVPVFSA